MVALPIRGDPTGFAATLRVAVPEPVPLWPLTTVIHASFDTAVHAQPLVAVTVAAIDPPVAGLDAVVGLIVGEQLETANVFELELLLDPALPIASTWAT